eukprot:UN24553
MVHSFLSASEENFTMVHCDDGFNITGFYVCGYLCGKLFSSVSAALLQFKKHRPPGLFDTDLIKALFKRFEPDNKDDCDEYLKTHVEIPKWHPTFSKKRKQDNGFALPASKKAKIEPTAAKPFVADPISIKYPFLKRVEEPQRSTLIITAKNLLKNKEHRTFQSLTKKRVNFPNSAILTIEKTYRMTWNPKSTRLLLFCHSDGVYFIDPKTSEDYEFGVYLIPKLQCNFQRARLKNTLAFGELVIDTVKEKDKNVLKY